jgi:hypothetical protein
MMGNFKANDNCSADVDLAFIEDLLLTEDLHTRLLVYFKGNNLPSPSMLFACYGGTLSTKREGTSKSSCSTATTPALFKPSHVL